MKKFLFTLAAVLCCVMVSTMFTSCSKDDDSEFGSYYAETVGDNYFGDLVCNQMDNALSSAFGNKMFYKRDDKKAIRVCDEVAKKVENESLVGTINLMMRIGNTDPDAKTKKIIKT